MASHQPVIERTQHRHLLPAALDRMRAAVVETAARRRRQRRRQLSRQHHLLLPLRRIDARGAGKQSLGVRMQGTAEHLFFAAMLYRFTEVHDQHVVSDVLHHRQVVGDEQIGHAAGLLQVHQQVQHLRLDRYVERGNRFIGHDHFRIQHQRARDRHPLALAAGEHVWITAIVLGPQANLGHHRLRLVGAFFAAEPGIDDQRLFQHLSDFLARIQAGVGILEHHLHQRPYPFQGRVVGVGDIGAVHPQLAAGRRFDHRDLARQSRFTAAGFAHYCQCPARLQGERDAVQGARRGLRLEQALRYAVMLDQVFCFKQNYRIGDCFHIRIHHHAAPLLSIKSAVLASVLRESSDQPLVGWPARSSGKWQRTCSCAAPSNSGRSWRQRSCA
ncbi:conserved hypothetical protein [Collimonas fungivorans Ter331]|uniref:Uncharacterized protein n=1 Tax=Collimonas fungivorans (strain Ter331) TaxID=1005048 RepID=G0AHA8_COLFT|nr:conserved hypothetical protein [Collimonas fungivorans Ter331]